MIKKISIIGLLLVSLLGLAACQTKNEDITLPDVRNYTREEALTKLSTYKLSIAFEDVVNWSVPEGRVIGYGNDLNPSDVVKPYTTVVVYISVHLNQLPDLTGLTQSEIISKFRGMKVILEFRNTLTNNIEAGQFVNYGGNLKTGNIVSDQAEVIIYLAEPLIETKTDLMISKYVEGSLYNRALELYNRTDESLDLSDYKVLIYQDGSNTPSITIQLEGVLEAKSTYVISYTESEQEILDKADFVTNQLDFNGNDTIAIQYYNGTNVDVLGNIGWGLFILADMTLVRNESINTPTTTFNINNWDRYAKNYSEILGLHPYVYPTTFNFDYSFLDKPFTEPGGVASVSFVSNNDGDTAQFTPGFTYDNRVRFIGIDTPETGSGIVATQARQYVYNALSNATTIYIQYDPASGNTDTYGRYLGLVWYDGKLLNYELVKNGFSQNNYSDSQGLLVFEGISLQTWMANAESEAKAAGLGVWG